MLIWLVSGHVGSGFCNYKLCCYKFYILYLFEDGGKYLFP